MLLQVYSLNCGQIALPDGVRKITTNFHLKNYTLGLSPWLRMKPGVRMAARGQSVPSARSPVEESEVVGVWGRRSAHTQEERLEPPYLPPLPQLRMQCQYFAVSVLPIRCVSLPLGPAPLLPSPGLHSPLFLSC